MFAPRYFPVRYFAPRYWPPGGGVVEVVVARYVGFIKDVGRMMNP